MSPLFAFHKLNEKGITKAQLIAADFHSLLENLEEVWDIAQESTREIVLAKTHLEKACFYAKKAMAMQKENQAD